MVKRSTSSPSSDQKSSNEKKPKTTVATTATAAMEDSSIATIHLTDAEEKLFAFLLDVEKQYNCKAVLRVAGGWVRDKLLGRESDDVDIAIDCMKGKEFADLINTYETDHGHMKHPVGVIKANPDQSKHLETATMRLGDGWVDFVNLRAETYSDDHRIPEVEFGTPQQDADRRDFTINSLFYNIAERKVEDFTRRGIEDLRNRVLRTPLDPRITFLDDPLRVLRAVRFASRFNCRLDDALRTAVELEEVKEALIKKVSRGRVGKELVGMLTGNSAHPERAIGLLHDLHLCKCIFLPPQQQPIFRPDGSQHDNSAEDEMWERGYAYAAAMHQLLANRSSDKMLDISKLSEDDQNMLKLRFLASFLLPFAGYYVMEKRRQVALPVFIVRESLKLKIRDAEVVGNVILKNVASFQALCRSETFERTSVGLLLRELGPLWELCRDVAQVKESVDSTSNAERELVAQTYDMFLKRIVDAGLVGVWDLKPLLNGNDLVKELGIPRGPGMKQILDNILIWQLKHPEKTREDCLVHFRPT